MWRRKKPFVQSSFPFLLTRCEDWLIEVLNIRPKMGWQFFWRSKDIICWVQNDVKLEICLFIINFKTSATITYHASKWQAWGNNWSWSEDWLIEVLNVRPKMSWQLFWRSKDIVYWVQNDVKLEICLFVMNFKNQ